MPDLPGDGDANAGTDVRREIVGSVGWIILNRPRAANAADPPMMRAVCEAIDDFLGDSGVRALVVRGEGRHFLAGGDLRWLQEIAAGKATSAAEDIYQWFLGATRRLATSPKPTIAAISGAAMTVGAELALACDVRLVDRSAFFAENWLELGLVAPLGGAMWLPRIIGLARAKEMLLECRRIGAEEAVAIGLANELLGTQAELYRRAQSRALAMASRPAAAFGRMKKLIEEGPQTSCEEGWSAGIAAQSELLQGSDFRTSLQKRLSGEESG